MKTLSAESSSDATDLTSLDEERQLILGLARDLDYFGRRAERFLSLQLQQLEVAIEDFERERTAWRRQQQRVTGRIEQQRRDLEQEWERLRGQQSDAVEGTSASLSEQTRQIAVHPAARGNAQAGHSTAPLRILLQPGSASTMQIGLLMFEISKVNREIGGAGVRFEVNGCRVPRKSAYGRHESASAAAIMEVEAFSCRPLARVDSAEQPATVHQRVWDTFKSRLLLSSLTNPELDKLFRKSSETARDHDSRVRAVEAARRAEDANSNCYSESRPLGPILRAVGGVDAVQQQLARLEGTAASLDDECSLAIHVSLV